MSTGVDRLQRRLDLGGRVNQLRRQRGWTTRQLAKESGVSDSYVSRLETGATAKPRFEDLELVANALGTTVFYLTNGYNPIQTGEGSGLPGGEEFYDAAFKLASAFEQGSAADKEFIKKSMDAISNASRH